MQLFGDLAARLPAAEDQHLAMRQRLRIAVVLRIDDVNSRRQCRDGRRSMRLLVRAGGENDSARAHLAVVGVKQERAISSDLESRDVDAFAHGRAERAAVSLQMTDDVVARHIAVRIRAVVCAAGELHRPVRRDEAETVPATAPGLADAASFEDDVLDTELGEFVTDGQAGLTGADDDDVEGLGHERGTVRGLGYDVYRARSVSRDS